MLLGDISLVEQLEKDAVLTAHKDAVKGLEAMKVLLEYCAVLDIKDKVSGNGHILLVIKDILPTSLAQEEHHILF